MSLKRKCLGAAKGGLKKCLKSLGYDLTRTGSRPSWEFYFDLLERGGFRPRTIFDIGVAYGTPSLYERFPDAFYYLVDPTRESLPYMQKICASLNATCLNVALGREAGQMRIDVRRSLGGSTLFEEVGAKDSVDGYLVPVERLDRLVSGPLTRPTLCKIDVQGAELLVLEGMTGLLDQIDLFVIEVAVLATLKGAPEFIDVARFLDEHGFVMHDVLSFIRRPLDQNLAQADIAFIRKDSPLRSDRRWSEA